MAERFNAAVLKTVEDASPPRVRISASPPIVVQKALDYQGFFVIHSKIFPLYQLAELWEKSSTTNERRTLGRRWALANERRGGEANPCARTKTEKPSFNGRFFMYVGLFLR